MTGIALYGNNGHQITEAAKSLRGARLCGSFGFTVPGLHRYASEEELAGDASVTLVSVCADLRSQQGAIIRRLLEAGKDVYAEKPLAMSAEEISALYALAREKYGFKGITLGKRILRAETAAISLCAIVLFELGELQ